MAVNRMTPRIEPVGGKGKEPLAQCVDLWVRLSLLNTVSLGRGCNEPFGSRSEPGIQVPASNLFRPSGEIPEGRARAPR
jgi:hypothetical protein